jgi:O-antigen biosynthesis protein
MFYKSKKFKGNLEGIINGNLVGWLADADSQAINSEVYVSANGIEVGIIKEFFYREDLEVAGIAAGIAAFELNILPFIEKLNGEIVFSFTCSDKKLFEQKLRKPDVRLLNTHWSYQNSDKDNQSKWSIDAHHRLGLRIDKYSSSHELLKGYGRYTRFNTSEKSDTSQFINISIPIDNIVNDIDLGSLSCCLIIRSDRLSAIFLELFENDQLLATEPLDITSSWTKSSILLIDQKINLNNTSQYKLKIKYTHQGQSVLDVAFCGVGEAPDLFLPKLTSTQDIVTDSFDPSIQNGELERWSRGTSFHPIVRGMELADGWFIECRKGLDEQIFINAESYYTTVDPLVFESPKTLLRVRTKSLEGYARIILPIDIRSFTLDELTVNLDVFSDSLSKIALIPRIVFIARTFKQDRVVFEVARNIEIKKDSQLSFTLNTVDLVELRKKLNDAPSAVLAIELDSNTDISIKKANLSTGVSQMLEDSVQKVVIEGQLLFEDDSINEQLNLIKGLDAWTQLVPASSKETLSSKAEFSQNSLTDIISKLIPGKIAINSSLPTVDIIIPVFNAYEDVLNCLVSIITNTTTKYNLILIDDCSAIPTKRMLEEFSFSYRQITLIRNKTNLGYTKTVNIGLRTSDATWKVVLNSDTIVTSNWLERLLTCALSQEKIGMVGALSNAASWQSVPSIFEEDGSGWCLNPLPEGLTVENIANIVKECSECSYPEVGVINGFCQLINSEMLNEIGLLDEQAFPTGFGEENDMCARAVKAGFKLLIADDVYIYHAKSKSFGHATRKELSELGSKALKHKHPDVDWAKVTDKIKNNPEMKKLRIKIIEEIQNKVRGNP